MEIETKLNDQWREAGKLLLRDDRLDLFAKVRPKANSQSDFIILKLTLKLILIKLILEEITLL